MIDIKVTHKVTVNYKYLTQSLYYTENLKEAKVLFDYLAYNDDINSLFLIELPTKILERYQSQ